MDYGRGLIGVDWEERVNFDRLRKDRIAKVRKAVKDSGVDLLLVLQAGEHPVRDGAPDP